MFTLIVMHLLCYHRDGRDCGTFQGDWQLRLPASPFSASGLPERQGLCYTACIEHACHWQGAQPREELQHANRLSQCWGVEQY